MPLRRCVRSRLRNKCHAFSLLTRVFPQEFNIEKLQVVEAEKQKIRKEYERKEGQVDVKKKMCV